MTKSVLHARMALTVILILTAWAFWPVLGHQFTNWDDTFFLLKNEDVRSLSLPNLKDIFTSTVHDLYVPLTILSFALEYHALGYDPVIYHATNLVLHLAITGMVFTLALQLGLTWTQAGFAALIFGWHPMHVESVAWITERKDVLYAFFYMLALTYYVRHAQGGGRMRYGLSLVFGLLSMLAKPMALSLPLILFVLDWFMQRRINRILFLEKIPYFVMVTALGWVTYAQHARRIALDLSDSMLIWIWSLTFYLKKFFLPLSLSPLHSLPLPVDFFHPEYWQSVGFAVMTVLVVVLLIKRKRRLELLGFLYFFFSIFFLLKYDTVEFITVADRYMYLPSVGFCLCLGKAVDDFFAHTSQKRFWLRPIATSLIVLGLMGIFINTRLQVAVWKDSFTLWNYVIATRPREPLAYTNRGRAFAQVGLYRLALADYNQAIKFDPGHVNAYLNRGVAYRMLKKYDQALQDYNLLINFFPHISDAYINRGYVFLSCGDYPQAIKDFDKALSLDPDSKVASQNRKAARHHLNQQDEKGRVTPNSF